MNIERRRKYFGDILSEESLTRTETPEIEELALSIISAESNDEDSCERIPSL